MRLRSLTVLTYQFQVWLILLPTSTSTLPSTEVAGRSARSSSSICASVLTSSMAAGYGHSGASLYSGDITTISAPLHSLVCELSSLNMLPSTYYCRECQNKRLTKDMWEGEKTYPASTMYHICCRISFRRWRASWVPNRYWYRRQIKLRVFARYAERCGCKGQGQLNLIRRTFSAFQVYSRSCRRAQAADLLVCKSLWPYMRKTRQSSSRNMKPSAMQLTICR